LVGAGEPDDIPCDGFAVEFELGDGVGEICEPGAGWAAPAERRAPGREE
jgi:hypothetical protein